MPVPVQTPYIEYTGNGSTTSFPLTFDCEKAEFLIVTINGTAAVVGSWSLAGGNVVFTTPPAVAALVVFKRSTPNVRTANYNQYDNSFRPLPVNKDFDKIWIRLQELDVEDWLLWRGLNAEIAARILADKIERETRISEDIRYNQLSIDRDNALQAYLIGKVNEVYTSLSNRLGVETSERLNGDLLVGQLAREYVDLMLRMNNSMNIFEGIADSLVMLPNGDNQRRKNGEEISVKDKNGASLDANDTTPLNNAIANSDNVLFNTQSVIKNCFIEKPVILRGTGNSYAKANAANESNVIIADAANHSNLVKNVTVLSMNFKDMPATDNDNWSALHFNTADGGIAAFNRFSDTNTGIRVGYYLDGSVSKDNAQISNVIVGAKTMGIELIQSKYNRTIGNVIHNNGVAVGKHGLRWSGGGIGNIAVGNNIRDRQTGAGLSLQVGNTNGVAVGNYFENISLSAVQTNSTAQWEGKHFIGGFVAKNIGLSGVDLDYVSSCFVQGLIDGTGDVGVRTSSTPSAGKHTLDLHIINAGNTAASIRSDKNLVKVLVDANTAGTPILVSGSNNLVIVLCADVTVSNSVFISGDNNTVIIQEAGTGTVGLRVDGSNNVITGRVTGAVSLNGSSNIFTGSTAGSLNIGASAVNTVVSGLANNITDSGTNTNFSGMIGGSVRTAGTFTTSATGILTITHGLKRAPKNVNLTLNQDSPYHLTVTSVSSTSINVKVRDIASAGAAVVSTAVNVNWSASM